MTHPDQLFDRNGRSLLHQRRRSRRLAALAGCLAALAGSVVLAEPGLQLVNECMETSTAFVSLPSSASGSLDARSCASCDSIRVTFESGTRFLVGRESVSYARLLAAAGKETRPLLVCYLPASRTIHRLILQ